MRVFSSGVAAFAVLISLRSLAPAQEPAAQEPAAQDEAHTLLANARRAVSEEVRRFDEHVTTLANPFFEGRLPGTPGMEIARQYMEYWFKQAGVSPGFPGEDGTPYASWRQPFPLRSTTAVTAESLAIAGNSLRPGTDFVAQPLGGAGSAEAPMVFCGFGIQDGTDGFQSLPDEADLSGKIAVILAGEPMDDQNQSLWSKDGWTRRSQTRFKVRALSEKGALGVIVVLPPGITDGPHGTLDRGPSSGRNTGVPMTVVTTAIGEQLVAGSGKSLSEWKALSNTGKAFGPLKGNARITVEVGEKQNLAENVGAILKGRGRLADELIVIGAHLDHLGYGYFGSRAGASGRGKLHPGADDNATGIAGVLMLAERLKKHYDAMPADAEARSILFVGWDAEEQGLYGSRHYVENPIIPMEKHALCVNFDMIGRIVNKRLLVAGADSSGDMDSWLKPILEESELEIVSNRRMPGGSDHVSFMQKKVPYLFSIIADFHDDYHTPADESWKINCVDGVRTVDLYEKIGLAAATRPEPIKWGTASREDGN